MTFLIEWWPQVVMTAIMVTNTAFGVYASKGPYAKGGAVASFCILLGLLYAGGFYDG